MAVGRFAVKLETVGGAKVWTGGTGDTLVLVHGAWGGAELHWGSVWNALADHFRVIAPELPGIGDRSTPGLASFDAYADWLVTILDALGVDRAWCAGNSLGAAVTWQLAGRLGDRCAGTVLVNGPPAGPAPAPLRALAAVLGKRRSVALFRKLNFSPATLSRGFADPAHVPGELAHDLAAVPTETIEVLLRLVLTGARTARPRAPVLLAWGAADRLPGSGAKVARKLERALDAKLVLIEAAGHCPQLERPNEVVDAITRFATRAVA